MKTSLQEMRRRAGFKSARAFAESIDMNPTTYTQYEQGIRNFTLEKAWEFADALECSLDELAGRQWPPEGAASSEDPMRDELVKCYDASTAENRHSLVVAARNAALASGDAAKRDLDETREAV